MQKLRTLAVPVLAIAALLGSASMLAIGGAKTTGSDAVEGAFPWETDVGAADRSAQETGKPLLLYFTADWCPPCKLMEANTWTDPDVQTALQERFTPVKVDIDAQPTQARIHAVQAIPTLIVGRVDGQPDRVSGYQSPERLLDWLEPSSTSDASAPGIPDPING